MLRKLTHEANPAPWRALRGRLWLEHALWLSGLTAREFGRTYVERGRSASNLMLKWRAGTVLPSQGSATALEKQLPGTAWLFDLPLFPLLENRRVTRRELSRLIAPWHHPRRHPADPEWKLPPDHDGRTVYAAIDTGSLLARGDIWGLAGIVASARIAELQNDERCHAAAIADAFRTLPSLIKISWSGSSVRDLFELITAQQRRVTYSRLTFRANWETIELLASVNGYDPDPLRRKALRGSVYSMFADPVIGLRPIPCKRVNRW